LRPAGGSRSERAEEMEETTFCPNCGKTFSDHGVGQRRESAIDWSGKMLCPQCNFFGFFLKISKKDYSKINFPNKKLEAPRQPSPDEALERDRTGFLAFIIAISVIAALAYFIAASL
jgi:hypothetical protein